MSPASDSTREPTRDNREVVDLVATVLRDPDLDADARVRLVRDIKALLRDVHPDLDRPEHGPAAREAFGRPLAGEDDHVASMVNEVLVNPNLHTDLRMRLCREIPALIRAADARTDKPRL